MMFLSTFVVASFLLAHLSLHEAFRSPERSVRRILLKKPLKSTTNDVEVKLDVVYDIDSWRNGYKTCKKETVEALESGIPADLEGTYYRNGFGKFESARVPILHPFDADGMMAAVTMKDGKTTYRNSFIRTRGFTKESKTRQMAARGTFGNHKFPGLFGNFLSTKIKNVANTNVIYWGGRLLALWEGGLPYKLDPKTLRCDDKEYTLRGLLKKGDTFTAHPRVDSKQDRLIAFSCKQNPFKSAVVKIFEFDNTLTSVAERSFEIPGFAFLHDFVVTDNYYIFNNAALTIDLVPYVLGQKAIAETIKTKGEPNIIYIVPRDGKLPAQTLEVPAHFNFHYANAFEDKQGNIVMDMIYGDKMKLGNEMYGQDGKTPLWNVIDREKWKDQTYYQMQRFTLTPSANKNELGQPASWTHEKKLMTKKNVDFASVNPKVSSREHRYVFSNYARDPVNASPPQGIVKLDTLKGTEDSWIGDADQYLSEPLFAKKKGAAPDADEDDGYILSFLNNWTAGESDFVVFDAKDIAKGPIYKSRLSVALPPGLHGTYADGLTFEQDDIIQKWRATNSLDRQTWNEVNSGFSGLGISYDL